MKTHTGGIRVAASLALSLALTALAPAAANADTTHHGAPTALGDGTASSYVTMDGDALKAVGVRLTDKALTTLPADPNTNSKCFDNNGDGTIQADECLGDYEMNLALPLGVAQAIAPIQWIALNWEAHGHSPPGIYTFPHFDFHFYFVDRDSVGAIRLGPCAEHINCDDLVTARMPLPAAYTPAGYVEVGAAAGHMGNHLINMQSPEFAKPPQPFTHTFIYGLYGGHITFVEPMVTLRFLRSRPKVCVPITQPAAWEQVGSYPTQYCMRHSDSDGAVSVSLEGFVHREATPAGQAATPGVQPTAQAQGSG